MTHQINAIQGDITKQNADAIVNAANRGLFGGSGVCGAIFDAAGYDDMTKACKAIGSCETGEAVITPGFKLPAEYVIHTVGPVYGQNDGHDAELLQSCYWTSLARAEENGVTSITFPLISTGIYGYPKEEAIRISIDAFFVAGEEIRKMLLQFAGDNVFLQFLANVFVIALADLDHAFNITVNIFGKQFFQYHLIPLL